MGGVNDWLARWFTGEMMCRGNSNSRPSLILCLQNSFVELHT